MSTVTATTPPSDQTNILHRIHADLKPARRNIVLLGLGRLQLGLVGPIFSSLGYHLIGVNLGSTTVVEKLRTHQSYRVVDDPPNGGYDVEMSESYHYDSQSPDSSDSQAAVRAAAEAQIINSALGVSGANDVTVSRAGDFLLAVQRYRRENAITEPLFITSSDNPVGNTFAVEFIQRYLQGRTFVLPEAEREALWNDISEHVRFSAALADRICSRRIVPSEEVKPLSVIVEPYKELGFSRNFLAMRPLQPPNSSALGDISIWDNIDLARERKIYTFSMAHALTAYYGTFDASNPRTIAEAIRSRIVRSHVEQALEDVARAFASQTGDSITKWYAYAGQVLTRIENERLDDPIPRVARDVPRKLHRSDRLVGPLLLVLRQSFRLSESLLRGIVLALLYAHLHGNEILPVERDERTHQLGVDFRTGGRGWLMRQLPQLTGLDPSDQAEAEIISRIAVEAERLAGLDGA